MRARVCGCGCVGVSVRGCVCVQVKEGTDLGKLAKEYMDKGGLVPDEVMIGILFFFFLLFYLLCVCM